MMRIAKIVQSIDTPSNEKTQTTTKGEKPRFRTELSLNDMFSGKQELIARMEGTPSPQYWMNGKPIWVGKIFPTRDI